MVKDVCKSPRRQQINLHNREMPARLFKPLVSDETLNDHLTAKKLFLVKNGRRLPFLTSFHEIMGRRNDDRRIPTLATAGSEGTKTERIPCDMNSIEKENVASDLYSDATSSFSVLFMSQGMRCVRLRTFGSGGCRCVVPLFRETCQTGKASRPSCLPI